MLTVTSVIIIIIVKTFYFGSNYIQVCKIFRIKFVKINNKYFRPSNLMKCDFRWSWNSWIIFFLDVDAIQSPSKMTRPTDE